MLLPTVALLLQQAAISATPDTVTLRPLTRRPVTPALAASAFANDATRYLVQLARRARTAQDSALRAYDAKASSRLSVGLGTGVLSRNRLLFRSESVSQVRWRREHGMWIEPLARRSVTPGGVSVNGFDEDLTPLPYFPGRETLWIPGASLVREEVNERDGFAHPLATGSEAYYRFAVGDSMRINLPVGETITLRELRVTARRPEWRSFVGSFWFDVRTGQLVRSAYRLSAPVEVWRFINDERERTRARAAGDSARARARRSDRDDVPAWIRQLASPLRADITLVTSEYALYDGRFWLPRVNRAEGFGQATFMKFPVTVEEHYRFLSVNDDGLPFAPLPRAAVDTAPPAIGRDDLPASGGSPERAGQPAVRSGQTMAQARAASCAASGTYIEGYGMYDRVRFAVRAPCDTMVLLKSTELPPSPYDGNGETFNMRDVEQLASTLGLSLQPGSGPQPPRWELGLNRARYNRVEGASWGPAASWSLGRGYELRAEARLGIVDREANGELSLLRSNGRTTVSGGGFRRLRTATDFGDPLTFGAGLGALLYGRDEGLYFRAWGADAQFTRQTTSGPVGVRTFVERHGDARTGTRRSLIGSALDRSTAIVDLPARTGTFVGVEATWRTTWGLDPSGWRLLADVRAEAAGGTTAYSRGLTEATLSHHLGRWLGFGATGSAGIATDDLPAQRSFYVGGLRTVRGQLAGTQFGTWYWFARNELTLRPDRPIRPSLFHDVGWAGPRRNVATPGGLLRGAGVGLSILDGALRFDLARGIAPQQRVRFDMSLESRF